MSSSGILKGAGRKSVTPSPSHSFSDHREKRQVALVEDDESARESLALVISAGGWSVAAFESAERFLESNFDFAGGCLVLDLVLPGMSGFELQERLAREERSLPTIVITGYGDVPKAVRAMKNGAMTFLEKPVDEKTLLAAIAEGVVLGQSLERTAIKKHEMIARFGSISADEMEVLRLVLEGHPNKRIASELDKGLRTIELRRSNIMKKSGASSLAELIRFAMIAGIMRAD